MDANFSFLSTIAEPETVVTAITSNQTFPEFVTGRYTKYHASIDLFSSVVQQSNSSAELLDKIRNPKVYNADTRMGLLKLFRRCVSTIVDTEKSKKLKNLTSLFVDNYGNTFKDIELLKEQFTNMSESHKYILTSLLGESDDKGKQGYMLTDKFFTWFENKFSTSLTIEGPRGAGRDVQLKSIFTDFNSDYPCDFIIKDKETKEVLAVGFARYDSTRGGSQSDDRTGGNNDKVMKADEYSQKTGNTFKLLFLSEGPGLTHKDTWEEACILDGKLEDRVRVSTLKLAETRITEDWLRN